MMGTSLEVHYYGCWHIMRRISQDPRIEDKCTCEAIKAKPITSFWGDRQLWGTITMEKETHENQENKG